MMMVNTMTQLSLFSELFQPLLRFLVKDVLLSCDFVVNFGFGQISKSDSLKLCEKLGVLLWNQTDQIIPLHVHEGCMEIRPHVFGIRSQTQGIEVETCCFIIVTLKSMSDTQVDPNSHIVWSDIEGHVIEFDGLVGSSQMSKGSTNFVHQQIVCGV